MTPLISTPWTSIVRNLTDSFLSRLVNDLISGDRKSGLFYMALSGVQLGTFDVLYDPSAHEQIFAGKIAYNDNRTYFDTWTSFPSRSARAGASATEAGPKYTLDNYRIESTIDSDLLLKAVSRFTLTPSAPARSLRSVFHLGQDACHLRQHRRPAGGSVPARIHPLQPDLEQR